MRVDGIAYRSIWPEADRSGVLVIDQTFLPHDFRTARLSSLKDAARAIRTMVVRGAPLIGATAAYGVALALVRDPSDAALDEALRLLVGTRPTAVNLRWALEGMECAVRPLSRADRASAAFDRADALCDEDVAINGAIGEYGLAPIRELAERKGGRVDISTHCNAGWLATVDWGTALAPIYRAHDEGIDVHVWVDETRPRNQGAGITAWELGRHGIRHTVVVDGANGHLMQAGRVDMCIVGTDRTTATGDVCNKIGTYPKALAASDNNVPFYVALPSPTIDWRLDDGVGGIPIEERDAAEVSRIRGRTDEGVLATVSILPPGSPAANYAFDVTPARLVTGLITERGIAGPTREDLLRLFPEGGAPADRE